MFVPTKLPNELKPHQVLQPLSDHLQEEETVFTSGDDCFQSFWGGGWKKL